MPLQNKWERKQIEEFLILLCFGSFEANSAQMNQAQSLLGPNHQKPIRLFTKSLRLCLASFFFYILRLLFQKLLIKEN